MMLWATTRPASGYRWAWVLLRGGTLVYVKFTQAPDNKAIRGALDKAGLHNAVIQRYGNAGDNEVVVKLDEKETSESDISKGKNQIINALETNPVEGKQDLNNSDRVGFAAVRDALTARDPMHADPAEYERLARRVLSFRDSDRGGVIQNLDDLKSVVPAPVVEALKQDFYTSNFGVRSADIARGRRWAGS